MGCLYCSYVHLHLLSPIINQNQYLFLLIWNYSSGIPGPFKSKIWYTWSIVSCIRMTAFFAKFRHCKTVHPIKCSDPSTTWLRLIFTIFWFHFFTSWFHFVVSLPKNEISLKLNDILLTHQLYRSTSWVSNKSLISKAFRRSFCCKTLKWNQKKFLMYIYEIYFSVFIMYTLRKNGSIWNL